MARNISVSEDWKKDWHLDAYFGRADDYQRLGSFDSEEEALVALEAVVQAMTQGQSILEVEWETRFNPPPR